MFYFPEFINNAILNGEASGLVSIDNEIYSLIAVPLLTPVPTAWIVLGFQIDDELIKELQSESHSHISLLSKQRGKLGNREFQPCLLKNKKY